MNRWLKMQHTQTEQKKNQVDTPKGRLKHLFNKRSGHPTHRNFFRLLLLDILKHRYIFARCLNRIHRCIGTDRFCRILKCNCLRLNRQGNRTFDRSVVMIGYKPIDRGIGTRCTCMQLLRKVKNFNGEDGRFKKCYETLFIFKLVIESRLIRVCMKNWRGNGKISSHNVQ